MQGLAVIDTGGTIGGILGPDDIPPKDDRVVDWLRERCCAREGVIIEKFQAQILCKKDSRALTESDRAALARAIAVTDLDRILVPHGTFTMPETGLYLLQNNVLEKEGVLDNKTVILVGSLVPLGEPDSDAPAALEFAMECLDRAGPGVWIAMSQRLWRPSEVEKDPVTGQFVARRSDTSNKDS